MSKNQKNAIASEIKNANLSKINLAQFANQLEGITLKEKRVKETIYIYPESFTKDKINSDEGKKYRNSIRNRLKSLCNNILYSAKCNDAEKLQEYVKQFESFYKDKYRINDYSISSITNSEKREKDIELMIAIIKEMKKS